MSNAKQDVNTNHVKSTKKKIVKSTHQQRTDMSNAEPSQQQRVNKQEQHESKQSQQETARMVPFSAEERERRIATSKQKNSSTQSNSGGVKQM